MISRSTVFATLAAVGLVACVPGLPSAPAAPPLSADQFPDEEPAGPGLPTAAAPSPTGSAPPSQGSGAPDVPGAPAVPGALASHDPGPFTETQFQDVTTPTKFLPQFGLGFDALRVGYEPEVTLDVYQTKGELEVKEVRALVENASFRYEKLSVGLAIGDGQMDVGTPPKLSLPVSITVTQTDGATFAVIAAKASRPLLEVYLSDIRIKQVGGNLSIVSISNLARGNNSRGQHTTEASARVVQRIFPGFMTLPGAAGAMRTRVLLYSEEDPANGATALRVHRQTVGVAP